jgi:hypothetical protein
MKKFDIFTSSIVLYKAQKDIYSVLSKQNGRLYQEQDLQCLLSGFYGSQEEKSGLFVLS